jgi:hypothetical protein
VEAGLYHLRLQSNACCPNVTAQPLRHPRLLPGTEYMTTIFKGFLMSTRNDVFALSLGRPSSEPHRPGLDRIRAAPTRGAGGGSTGDDCLLWNLNWGQSSGRIGSRPSARLTCARAERVCAPADRLISAHRGRSGSSPCEISGEMPLPLAANPFPAIASGLNCSGVGTTLSVAVCANIWLPHARRGSRTSPPSPVPRPLHAPQSKDYFLSTCAMVSTAS